MISAPEDAVLVTRSSSTAGKHIARLLKSSNGGEIVTFGGDFRCTTQDSGSSVISYFACTGLGNLEKRDDDMLETSQKYVTYRSQTHERAEGVV